MVAQDTPWLDGAAESVKASPEDGLVIAWVAMHPDR